MTQNISQGDILSIENIKIPILVVSKDFFNRHGQIIACPVVPNAAQDALHIPVSTKDFSGIVLCEQLKFLDVYTRGYKRLSYLSINDVMNITDAIQGIFDYYP